MTSRLYVYRFQKDDSYFGSGYLTDQEAARYNLNHRGILYAVPWVNPIPMPQSTERAPALTIV